jgi:hypothetical protein
MAVALLGVAADTTNSSPTPPVYPDNTFEYIPIPEAQGPEGTTENKTYGNTKLRHRDATAAEYLDSIQPSEDEGPEVTGDKLAEWPLHYDPNFDALTYGESTNRGSYTKILRSLDEGDTVAFYTGLRGADASYTHRYIIGYFTVEDIVDFQKLEGDGEPVTFSELPSQKQEEIMARHSENAHAKRFKATGNIADNDGLVIVEGKEPGGLLDKAFRISEHHGGGHHYLTDELQEKLPPKPGGNPSRNAYLGGIKKAHSLNISSEGFRNILE